MAEADPQPVRLLTDEDESARGHRLRFIVLGVAVAVAVGFMVYAAFPSNTQYFLTVDEFMAGEEYQDGQMLRVSGKLVADSFVREEGSTQSYFRLTSGVEQAHPQVTASYVGVMPDLFFNPHSEIVLEGRYSPEEGVRDGPHPGQVSLQVPGSGRGAGRTALRGVSRRRAGDLGKQ